MESPPAQPSVSSEQTIAKVLEAITAALPELAEHEVIDILEFIHVQHGGSSFNPDNTAKAAAIIGFLNARPFAGSARGVSSLAKLARHALTQSEGSGNSPEHQLWLLSSCALNTAAAVAEFDGDAAQLFDELDQGGLSRGKYMQRYYAQRAMKKFVAGLEQNEAENTGSVSEKRGAIRKYFAPENLSTAYVYVTFVSIALAWLLHMYLFPDWR